VSHLPPPLVDPRGYADFVARTEELVELYTGGWRPAPGDPASALVRVFARMAERVADRLNRVPDRNFLAYLDLLGIELRPPQPARAPLTFFLAAGSASDALVPARTPVAGQPLEGESEPVVFETERELLVTRTTLAAVAVRDPGRDRWADYTARNDAGAWFPAFEGEVPMTHRLHLSHRAAFGAAAPKAVTLRLRTASDAPFWPAMTEWSWIDAAGHHPLLQVGSMSRVREAVIDGEGQEWEVAIGDLPAVPESTVAGFPGAWITGRLTVPLRLRAVAPDAVRAGERLVPPGEPFAPFGRAAPHVELLISAADVFSVPGARARIDFELERPLPEAQSDLRVRWEYTTIRMGFAWAPLGLSARDREWAEEEHVDNEWEFGDGTFALSRDGAVTFRVPRAWKRESDTGEMWLRARVEAGGYTGPDGPRPPVVRRVTVGYDLPVPDLAGVRVQAEHRSTEDRPPAAAFAGTAPLDLSKDFLPFGDAPRRGDAFYLAVPELAGKPDASAALAVTVVDPAAAEDVGAERTEGEKVEGRIVVPSTPVPLLVWEYWSRKSERWETLAEAGTGASETKGFDDPSKAFSVPGEHRITLPVPVDLGEAEVNGRRDTWLRVRIARGGYGSPARYEEVSLPDGAGGTVKGWRLVPPTYRPPALAKLALGYEYASPWTEPDAVVTENDWSFTPVIPGEGGLPPFAPFAPSSESPAPDEAPRPRQRPILYLGFQRPGDVAGFANRTTTLFFGVGETRYGDEEDVTASGEPPALAWEYWNGAAWARLGVRDETAAFTRRGMATFVGPADFRASSEFGREAFWLRVRVERGGWRHPPRLERVLLNTVWAEQATRVSDEVLGSGNGKPGQSFRAARAPVLAGERVEVREAEVPSAHERDDLAREAGADAVRTVAAPGGAAEVWVRWSAVPDFHGSGPRSRHYTVDRLTGGVLFGDGTRGMVPPQGRANVRVEYRSGGGPKGNRPAGNLTQLKTTVPYVDRVTNREPAGGGAAAESLESVRRRGPHTLRHRGRAVTTADLEDLAMEASAEVAVAHAVGAATEADAGNVRVIVVPSSAAARPVPSLELLDRVETYLAERIPATVALEVVGPEWVAVDVAAEFVPDAPESAGEAALALEARLAAYLHPLTGGPEGAGWPFGRRPHRSDLYAVAEATPGVDHLLRLDVREATVARTPFFLVHSGTHAVTVVGSTDE
jgi:uncharacterized phage protein gp47/JayE